MKIIVNEGQAELVITIDCPLYTPQISQMVAELRSFGQKLSGTKDGQTHLIERQDVFYVESVDKRCFIYTEADVYETSQKLYQFEECQGDLHFFRSSKSQVVNIMKISSLCPDFGGRIEIVMENGEKLVVSRQFARTLKERLGVK
ncbi:MAG: LytTR family transcriptional regulator DNA-binding domain-containing protein [Lachnospiraceae bacterium]|jgi:DNA-binding LytR/AlgR family response regulator|nr:LytTR family transcriptional regulator DNA-binding domain-containing protein [Lachnospiraceae bacterium]